jgi:hypothetical protein
MSARLYLADLLGVGFAEGSTKHCEILAEDEHLHCVPITIIYCVQNYTSGILASADLSAVNKAVTSNDTITIVLLLLHAELVASVRLEHVVLAEAAIIKQKIDALPSGKLSARVLGVNSLLSTAQKSAFASLVQAGSERILQCDHRWLCFLCLTREAVRQNHSRHSSAVVAQKTPQHRRRFSLMWLATIRIIGFAKGLVIVRTQKCLMDGALIQGRCPFCQILMIFIKHRFKLGLDRQTHAFSRYHLRCSRYEWSSST